MAEIVYLTPNEWVTADVLMTVTGLKKGRINSCRQRSWQQGKEYLLVSSEGTPKKTSEAMYHLPSINKWILKQAAKQPKI